MSVRVAARVAGISPSPSLAVSAEVRRLRGEGVDVVDFGVGELDFPTVKVAKEAGKAAIDADFSRYTPTPGTPELRAAIACWHHGQHGSGARPEDVVVGAGAKPLLYELMQALVEPGDDVVVHAPYWVSFPAQVAMAGGRLVPAMGDAAEGFVPRAAQVEAAMTEKTRVVICNSPCNPTGAVMPGEEVGKLVDLCARRNVVLVFDEVYDRLVFDGEHVSPLSFRERHPEMIVCVGSASKSFAMTGWRLGYLVAPGAISEAVARMQGHVTSCASSIAQAAATAAFTDGGPEVEQMVETLRERRDHALAMLEESDSISCPSPAGTFFLFPRFDLGTGETVDSAALAVHLLRTARTACVPGSAFGRDGHLRMSFAVSKEDMERGLGATCEELARLRSDPGRLGKA